MTTRSHNIRSSELGKPEVRSTFARQDVERFWSKVQKAEGDACWLWLGSCQPSGYGQIGVMLPGSERRQATYYAHRVAWALSHGPIPDGKDVLHHCDVRHCVNPAHLYVGTHDDNMRDATVRNRLHVPRPSGQRVTEAQLEEIFNLILCGMKQVEVARRFGVSKSYVSLLLRGKRRQFSPVVVREGAA